MSSRTSPEDGIAVDAAVVDARPRSGRPRKAESVVGVAADDEARLARVDEEHRGAPSAGARCGHARSRTPAPSAPVMKRFSPTISQPSPSGVAVAASAAGSDPAPGCGSVIAKQERTSPRASGRG